MVNYTYFNKISLIKEEYIEGIAPYIRIRKNLAKTSDL